MSMEFLFWWTLSSLAAGFLWAVVMMRRQKTSKDPDHLTLDL